MEFEEVTCPTCFELFSIALPYSDERPTELDYDCEVCCRPMAIHVTSEGYVDAYSLDDLA